MNTSVELFSIRGIRIGINWSWLVVFALIVWTLATGIFPRQNPGLSDGTYVAMAVIAAVLFFASLLGHELGHAIQARREGMQIEGITLWLFGGIAKFKGSSPRRAASSGSRSRGRRSRSCSASLSSESPGRATCRTRSTASRPGSATSTLRYSFSTFSRPCRSTAAASSLALWKAATTSPGRRDLRGHREGFGYLMIAGGVFLFIFEGAFSGAWLVFIGWFLLTAATAEERYLKYGTCSAACGSAI